MPKVNLPITLAIVLTILVAILSYTNVSPVKSAIAGHVVISEILVGKTSAANDEFVELYNPTGTNVDLTGWRLGRKSSTGSAQANLVASMSGMIKSHGYFLLTSNVSSASGSADLQFTPGIAANNTILLFSDAGTTVVDKVGYGSVADSETASASASIVDQSLERKANSSSDVTSMTSGVDQLAGNGEDSDNNSADFITRETPEPQNSLSDLEPAAGPSPSPSVSPSTSASPEASANVSPSPAVSASPSASVSPSPSLSPSPSPSVSTSPSISPSPSVLPSSSPSPIVSPSASPSPSASVIASASPSPIVSPIRFKLDCSATFRLFNFGFFQIRVPIITCRLIHF